MDFVKIAHIILFGMSAVFVLLYFMLGARTYCIFLAFAFTALGLTLVFTVPGIRYALIAFAAIAIVLAILDLVRDTRERIGKLRQEHLEREEAFSDLLQELAKHPDTAPPPPSTSATDDDHPTEKPSRWDIS